MRQPYHHPEPAILLARQNGGRLVRQADGTWRGRPRDLPRRVEESVVLGLARRGEFFLTFLARPGAWAATQYARADRPCTIVVHDDPPAEHLRFRVAKQSRRPIPEQRVRASSGRYANS